MKIIVILATLFFVALFFESEARSIQDIGNVEIGGLIIDENDFVLTHQRKASFRGITNIIRELKRCNLPGNKSLFAIR